MFGFRDPATLSLLSLAVLLAAAAGSRPPAPPEPGSWPLPPVEAADASLQELRRSARTQLAAATKGSTSKATLLAELHILVQAAEAVDQSPVTALGAMVDVLQYLSFLTSHGAEDDGARERARRMAALHQTWRHRHPAFAFPQRSSRVWAQACLEAGDLPQAATAVAAALAAPTDGLQETARVHLAAAHLHGQLGRPESVAQHLASARPLLDSAEAKGLKVAGDRQRLALASADLHLRLANPEQARLAIADLPSSPVRDLYSAMIAAMEQAPDAAERLQQLLPSLPPRLYRLALCKLIKLKLRQGSLDEAVAAQLQLERATPTAGDAHDHDEVEVGLRMELALQGKLPVDERLLHRARAIIEAMVQRWQLIPELGGGAGWLDLDDHATALANLLLVEAALAPEQPATAALTALTRVHARLAGQTTTPAVMELLDSLLTEGSGLLVVVPGRFRSLALMFHGGAGTLRELPGAATLRARARQLRESAAELCRSGEFPRERLATLVESARDFLPPELRAALDQCSHVTMCGAGMLDGLPFELLPHGAVGEPRGLRQSIHYVDNLVDAALRSPFRRTGPVLFAGSLRYTASSGAAVGIPRRAVAAGLAAHGADYQTAFDGEVNVASVRRALPSARIAQLTGHGIYLAGRSDPNGIAFGNAPTEQLFAAEVLDLDLTGQMVLLSACGLANNPRRRGGDAWAPSLAGALLRAGAHSVLAATVELELHRHLAAMAVVHRELAQGRSLAQALLPARQSAASPLAQLELLLMHVQGRGH